MVPCRAMPEIHLPKLDEHGTSPGAAAMHVRSARGKWAIKFALEVLMISLGVVLGLAGEQWRERRHRCELAETSLRRFRAEIETNRKAVADVRDYHANLLKTLDSYLSEEHKNRNTNEVQTKGLRFIPSEPTAWDLALTTQAIWNRSVSPSTTICFARSIGRSRVELDGTGSTRT